MKKVIKRAKSPKNIKSVVPQVGRIVFSSSKSGRMIVRLGQKTSMTSP